MATVIETYVKCGKCKTNTPVSMMASSSINKPEQFNTLCVQCGAIIIIQVTITVKVVETKSSQGRI